MANDNKPRNIPIAIFNFEYINFTTASAYKTYTYYIYAIFVYCICLKLTTNKQFQSTVQQNGT